MRLEVSARLREEWHNGREYYAPPWQVARLPAGGDRQSPGSRLPHLAQRKSIEGLEGRHASHGIRTVRAENGCLLGVAPAQRTSHRRHSEAHRMITGDIRSQIDSIWNTFWTGGISNPLEVIEQITYLLFLRRLDDLQTLEENKAARTRKAVARRIFPEGKDKPGKEGRSYEDFRWSRFKHFEAKEMYEVIGGHVFPWLRTGLATNGDGEGSTYAHHMKDARFTIPTPALLAKVVDMLEHVPMEDRDTKGDVYEYMLGKIATAGQNGQFRTPRHTIRLMVELTAPQPLDVICDPACGTAGFLVAAGEHLRERHSKLLHDAKLNEFHHHLFHGFDFDNPSTMISRVRLVVRSVVPPSRRARPKRCTAHRSTS
ncbi:MAG: type I restriction-modification system subunit M N-terminal domain-containing protein [Burkholderiales bacterium]